METARAGGGCTAGAGPVALSSKYLDALAADMTSKPPSGAFTLYEAAQRCGASRTKTMERLNHDVKRGVLRTDIFTHNGTRTRFYWLIENGQ